MKSGYLALVFGVAFVVFVLVKAPLGTVLAWAGDGQGGLVYEEAEGTVWDGRLRQVAVRDLALGIVDVKLSPLALATLQTRVHLRFTGGDINGETTVERSFAGGDFAIEDADLIVDLQNAPTIVPLVGRLLIKARQVSLDPNGCHAAELAIESDALARSFEPLNWQGPILSGKGECRNGDLALSLKGQSGAGAVEVDLLIAPDLGYEVEAIVRAVDERIGQTLLSMGFREMNGRYVLRAEGTFAGNGKNS